MENKRYYIAYGSNLSVEQMKVRCPDARIAGMSFLKDWKLVFKVHATIEPCKGRVVPVLVWEISERDEANLDYYEGYPSYYFKQDMDIEMTDLDGKKSKSVSAMVYVMGGHHTVCEPMRSYYEVLQEGYRRFGFNTFLLELALQEAREEENELPGQSDS